ncbi:MAG TPA: TonB-dependent receptor [Rhizomicrobium sp.]|jgi:iron complex outermembrane receptor protein
MSFKGALVGSTSLAAIFAILSPAYAQTSPVEEVIVTGIRASAQRSIDTKRNSVTIMDSISAEDIGKLPDRNVADTLQRIPGINTFSQASGEGGFDENDRIGLRGTNPSLTQTTIDGHSVATGDWFILDQYQTVGRSVSFTLFPAEIVDKVNVYKSQEADFVEGGVAGSVDIVTRKPLDFGSNHTFEASAQGVYSDLPGKWDPQVNGLFAWQNDSGTFGFMVQGFYEERDLRRDGQEFLGYNSISCTLNTPGKPASGCDPTKGGQTNIINAHPDLYGVLYPSLIGSALFLQKRKREGGDATIEWRPNNSFDFLLNTFYSHLDADNFNNNFMVWNTNEIANADNLPTSYKVKNNTLIAATFPKINPITGAPVDGVVEDSIYRPGAAAETWYVDGDATWKPDADWTVHGKLGYTEGKGETPSQPTWESDAVTGLSYDMSRGVAAVDFPDIDTTNAADFSNDWAWSDKFTATDKEFYTQADFERAVDYGPLSSIKFGARYADHTRNVVGFDRGTCAFACPGSPSSLVSSGGQYPSDFANGFKIPGMLTNIWLPDTGKIQKLVMPNVTPYTADFFYWPGSFKVHEKDWAAYAMANLAGDHWTGNIGLRFVHTQEDINTYVSDATGTANAYGNFDLVPINHSYTDPLPSANFAYDLTDDMKLRLAAARVISRPDYSALGGAVSLTDTILTGTGGNPDLKPVRAWTYDASWEWYFNTASILAVDVFYMDLNSYVTFGTHNATYLNATLTGQQGHPVYSDYVITSPENTSGTDKGIELQWQQPIWSGFGIQANYTYADGKESGGGPLVGDAKNTYNLTGYYENDQFSVRLAYTWRSNVLIGLDRSTAENEASIGSLDASASYSVTDNISLTFDALNLTDELLKYYANNETQPRAIYDNGRQFFMGVRVRY